MFVHFLFVAAGDYADAKYHPSSKTVWFMGQYAGERIFNLTYDTTFYSADSSTKRSVWVLENTQTTIGVVHLPSLLGKHYSKRHTAALNGAICFRHELVQGKWKRWFKFLASEQKRLLAGPNF